MDALDPMTDEALDATADMLLDHLARLGPDVHVARHLAGIARAGGGDPGPALTCLPV
jgi:hypothetical protein